MISSSSSTSPKGCRDSIGSATAATHNLTADSNLAGSILERSLNNQLLLRPQLAHNIRADIQCLCHDMRWCQSEPLRQADIDNAIRLVELDPYERFVLARVLDVMAGVVWEDGGVPSAEVEGAGETAA